MSESRKTGKAQKETIPADFIPPANLTEEEKRAIYQRVVGEMLKGHPLMTGKGRKARPDAEG